MNVQMNLEVSRPTAASGKVLEGKVAFATGSNSDIGLGIAQAFATAGASLRIDVGTHEDEERTP